MMDDPRRDRLFKPPETGLEHHRNRLWLSHGVALCLLLVAVFNPVSLERWAAAHPPNWGVETVRLTIGVWSDRMGLARLDQPRLWLEQRWLDIKATGWDDVFADARPEEDAPQQPADPEETS